VTVAGFGRLLAKEQAKEEAERSRRTTSANTSSAEDPPRMVEPEAVATECLLYGYAEKSSEWKVISKFERIVAPSIICEDYPRENPTLFLSSNSPYGHSRSAVVTHNNLSKDALKKSRIYRGGKHWIKVTFDSYQAAERACFYSPVEIDGYLVYCEMWEGRAPFSDQPLLKGMNAGDRQRNANIKIRDLTTSQSNGHLSRNDSAIAGFERAITLPRSHTMPDVQYDQPTIQDDASVTSTTASSATATDVTPTPTSGLRSRSIPRLPTQATANADSIYMTHIPSVKRAVLRPMSEALPPQPTLTQRVLRSIPILNWFFGSKDASGDVIGEGPTLKEDGSWDDTNGWYWSFWHFVDGWIGTDFCGMKDD